VRMWTERKAGEGQVIAPDERLAWPAMFGLGGQHVLAMFGSTAIVPVLIGFPVSTTLLFSGIGTLLFVLITRNRVPSYTGSSFAFIAPVIAAKAEGGIPAALGGILCAGVVLFLVGLLIDRVGYRVVEFLLPPVVTGAIVALIGLNLAPVAKDEFSQQAGIALFTLAAILLATVALRGLAAKLSVFLGVTAGYIFAAILGKVDWTAVHKADWIGFPEFTAPVFNGRAILLVVPAVVLVLLAEN
jgi:xanthine/uracil permease